MFLSILIHCFVEANGQNHLLAEVNYGANESRRDSETRGLCKA